MKIIVQKFGGTSVRDIEGRIQAKHHIEKAIKEGYKVVVVVSAMGRKGDPYATDTLLSLVNGSSSQSFKTRTGFTHVSWRNDFFCCIYEPIVGTWY